jgi:hypothetical protein
MEGGLTVGQSPKLHTVAACEMGEKQHLVVLDFDWTVMLMVTSEACTAHITNDTR